LLCNNQIGLIIIILLHLFHPHNIYGHIDNIIFNPIHTCITLIKVMQMHWIILLLCNTHAQDNMFHLIWFKNSIIRLFWSYAIPSCLGYISYHLIEQSNTLWTHWSYHIQANSHMHYLHEGDALPQGQNTSIISNHIHIYITLIRVDSFLCFVIALDQLKLFHFIYFNNAIPWRHIENNLCWPYMQYLNMGVNQYLIATSHNIKVKKFSSIAIPLFDLPYSCWGYIVSSWA
jgi:hypothetical protein